MTSWPPSVSTVAQASRSLQFHFLLVGNVLLHVLLIGNLCGCLHSMGFPWYQDNRPDTLFPEVWVSWAEVNKLNREGKKQNADKAVGATFLLKDLFGRGRIDGKVSIDTCKKSKFHSVSWLALLLNLVSVNWTLLLWYIINCAPGCEKFCAAVFFRMVPGTSGCHRSEFTHGN